VTARPVTQRNMLRAGWAAQRAPHPLRAAQIPDSLLHLPPIPRL